jgi:hypothetical protein
MAIYKNHKLAPDALRGDLWLKKRKNIIMKAIISILSIVLSSFTVNSDGPRGPHQGTVKPMGDYQLEVLGCMDHLEVYVLDKKLQSISNFGMSGTVTFYFPKGDGLKVQPSVTSPLVSYGRDGFSAKLPTDNFSYSLISMSINDRKLMSGKFDNECSKISVTK